MPQKTPGPTPLQLLRQLKNLRDHPHEYLLNCYQQYGDVVHFEVPGNQAYFINHPDDVQRVLQMNYRNYSKDTFQYNVLARITGDGLLTSNGGEGWLTKRRIAQPAFSKGSLQALVPIVAHATNTMMARWQPLLDSGEALDIDREMMQCALDVVAKMLFGADLSEQAFRLTGAVMDALDYLIFQTRTLMMVPGWLPTHQNRKFKQAMAEIENVVNLLIDQRSREEPGEDFLGLLLGACDESGRPLLSRLEIRDEVVTILIAGHETVASSLAWSWYLLAQNPAAQAQLAQEAAAMLETRTPGYADLEKLTFTHQAYNESLRLFPPAWLITRRAIGADQLGAYDIPPGALIIISPYVMHRRPDLWPEPDIFTPERFIESADKGRHRFGFIPFGGGPRLCIGNRFAYIEAVLILAMVARRFTLNLTANHSVTVEALVTMRPAGGLPMQVIPHACTHSLAG